MVWIRDSQAKINYPPDMPFDAALFTVDLLRSSHMATPSRLSVETIVNFAENGVGQGALVDLLNVSLTERTDRLTKWTGEGFSMHTLFLAVAQEGGVFSARLARMVGGAARFKGLVYEDRDPYGETEDEDCLEDAGLDAASSEQSSAWWPDPISGQPSTLEDTVLGLLVPGFTPGDCPALRAKLKRVAEKPLNPVVNKLRLLVPMSCSAFIIPGTLLRRVFRGAFTDLGNTTLV